MTLRASPKLPGMMMQPSSPRVHQNLEIAAASSANAGTRKRRRLTRVLLPMMLIACMFISLGFTFLFGRLPMRMDLVASSDLQQKIESKTGLDDNKKRNDRPLDAAITEQITPAPTKVHQTYRVIKSVVELRQVWNRPDFRCRGWTQTALCNPEGDIEPQNSKDCDTLLDPSWSGYCLFSNTTTGELIRVMPKNCRNVFGEVSCHTLLEVLDYEKYEVLSTAEEVREVFVGGDMSCEGWKQTAACNPFGPREITKDNGRCRDLIPGTVSGFCEYLDMKTKKRYHVLGKTCDSVYGRAFRCSDVLEIYMQGTQSTKDITTSSELDFLRNLHAQNQLRCLGFRALGQDGERDAYDDVGCDSLTSGAIDGYCAFVDANSTFYNLHFGVDKVIHNHHSCKDLLLPKAHDWQSNVVPITSRAQYDALRHQQGWECVGFRYVRRRSGKRVTLGDARCDEQVLIPGNSWCEYRTLADGAGTLYRLYLNGSVWRGEATCQDPLTWYWRNLTIIEDFEKGMELVSSIPDLKCMGLRRTRECDPHGERLFPDKGCDWLIIPEHSGYCEFSDSEGQKSYGLLPFSCKSFISLTCGKVPEIFRFAREIRSMRSSVEWKALSEVRPKHLPPSANRGIVICVGQPIWINAFVLLRLLNSYGVGLPIEVWSIQDELQNDVSVLEVLRSTNLNVTFRVADMDKQSGFYVKVFAVLHTSFDEVMVIDADNYPVRDPEYLFNDLQYRRYGAFFWPDFWHVENPELFAELDGHSYLWKMLGIDMLETPEQESGQILIDRRRAERPFHVLQLFLKNTKVLSHFVHGDKDLFRLAWMVADQRFHMKRYPGSAGYIDKENQFCGKTMVQFDNSDQVAFLHRNLAKFSLEAGRRFVWEYVQRYAGMGYPRVRYHGDNCFDLEDYSVASAFRPDKELEQLESALLAFTTMGYTSMASKCSSPCTALHGIDVGKLMGIDTDTREFFPAYNVEAAAKHAAVGKLAKAGFGFMKTQSVAIGLVLQSGETSLFHIRYFIPKVERLARYFRDYRVILAEDGIEGDADREIVAWLAKDANVKRLRLPKANVATLRNSLLTEAREGKQQVDFYISYDPILIARFESDGIASSFGLLVGYEGVLRYPSDDYQFLVPSWDVMCSNLEVETDQASYFGDITTFRGLFVKDETANPKLALSFPWLSPTFELDSCHGSLAIYNQRVLAANCTYPDQDTGYGQEIVKFHECLRKEIPPLAIRLNPRQRIHWKHSL